MARAKNPAVPRFRERSPPRYHREMTIDILCKVVDNYGDIGVAWRLARALSEMPDAPGIRLVVDELAAFESINPSIDPGMAYQRAGDTEIIAWGAPLAPEAAASYRARPARALVECFACGRPDWLEDMLFSPLAPSAMIVDLEHLTAESYARELHLAPSLTRSSSVRKAMYMPGFEEGTGGLVIDRDFKRALELASSGPGRTELRRDMLARIAAGASAEAGAASAAGHSIGGAAGPDFDPADAPDRFWVAVFGYERDYSRIVADLATFAGRGGAVGAAGGPVGAVPAGAAAGRPLLVLAAAGKSQACFMAAWEALGRPFPAIALPFLPQEDWDRIIAASDFSIVRGEDSWARAALAGRPFLWQAYPQAERYHMVKVEAFLGLLGRFFDPGDFGPVAQAYRAFNDRDRDLPRTAGEDRIGPMLEAYEPAAAGFAALGADLASRTDLASDLLTFFRETV